ncbi:SAM-dependent methyltransferase [Thermodesulforhabdus norvegica]|uniref:tRNA-Thr(GGU) m(6)t(6)A37 methyltransferase TsaA n=1 Tax=Thermodesulforhabdus norvegica TaxID=39841 RepID=A0A1I4QK75_9BACT|nr:SAM-dependent methyltransferase [Thermodesulforhabdus norvegica]SFM40146.1 tRNA-Thr(GGU) m(6)t(6)A37 methyltransferase TsaA [Thermodesulforhabdus norvegica]
MSEFGKKEILFFPIGFVRVQADKVPRHWTVSDLEGEIVIDPAYSKGLSDISTGDKIVVLFYFHKSPPFSDEFLIQKPPHKDRPMGVFSICSPIRPNAIGLSVLDVIGLDGNVIKVRGIDMYDGTPVLDIKPFVEPPKRNGGVG